MEWIGEEPQPIVRRRAMLTRREREWLEGGDVIFGVFLGDAVVGGCGLHRRGECALSIGYWVHPSFTRQGIATRVAQLLTGAAFSVRGIAYVEIHHDKANLASAGVPRRLGFRFLGETADGASAPAELGIDCTWQMDRARWQRRGSSPHS